MKFFSILTLNIVLSSLVMAEELPKAVHPSADDPSFANIFDGKDLSNIETEGNWQIQKDGTLHLTPREGEKGWTRYASYIWLKEDFTDFVFDFEFKYAKDGNSGLYFRCSDKIDPTKSGFEIQILDSFGSTKSELGHHDMAGVIQTCGPLVNGAKAAGEWQQMTVTMKGDHLTVVLNNQLVQDINLREKKPANKELSTSGKICIQDHGLPFSVRNIRVKKL